MQVSKRTIRQMKVRMKAYFPGEYASIVAETLRQRGVEVTLQQVYNFFNNVPVSKRQEILTAAVEILCETHERNQQLEEILEELV